MALETAPFINGLNPANPSGSDRLHQGDDHIRMIKQALKSTFPNLTGPITLNQDQINGAANQVPTGLISMWFGAASTIPTGWALCDGSEHNRVDGTGTIKTPKMTNILPIGAGSLVDLGEATGSVDYQVTTGAAGKHTHTVAGGAHTHEGQVGSHALTIDQIPAHKHGNGVVDKNDNLFNHGGLAANPTKGDSIDGNSSGGTREGYTTTEGKGQAHSHSLSISESGHSHTVSEGGEHTHSVALRILPPVLGVHFIMKL
ncbi:hypothetical protein [Novosphingobium panipatense]|nr:hypothetical protein [Novosphingobium panipatense]